MIYFITHCDINNNNNNSLFQTYVHMHNKNIIIKNTYIKSINEYITV